MANEDKGPWWVIGVQIHAAMDPDRGQVEAFLAEHAGQATDACLGFLRTIPAGIETDLAPLVEHLGEQIRAHTEFLCGQADLNADQAERLMAASRRGYGRFVGAFQLEARSGRGGPGAGLLPGIEAALAAGGSMRRLPQPPGPPHRAPGSPPRWGGRPSTAASRPNPVMTASERTDPMNSVPRPGRRPTDPGGNPDSRALDRYEDEGGPGPEDTRDRRRDAPTTAPTGDRQVVNPGRVVATSDSPVDACQAHHRDIPGPHADDATPRVAAANPALRIENVAAQCRRKLRGRVLGEGPDLAAQGP